MVLPTTQPRPLVPGTTGWSAADLRDPEIARQWDAGRYEIIDGILVTMPPPYMDHGEPLPDLTVLLRNHLRARGCRPRIAVEVDIISPWGEVFQADAVLLTESDVEAQRAALRRAGQPDDRLQRLLIAPTVVIESVSRGHEKHDREFKRQRYARLGVGQYWIVDHSERSLDCLRLVGDKYELDSSASGDGVVEPSAFPGFRLAMGEIFP